MNPEMLSALSKTWNHICEKTLHECSPAQAIAILKSAPCRAAEATVNRLAATGDILATRQACQAWNTALCAAREDAKKP